MTQINNILTQLRPFILMVALLYRRRRARDHCRQGLK